MPWPRWMQAPIGGFANRRPPSRARHEWPPRAAPAASEPGGEGAQGEAATDGDAPVCGWFDSSHELARGLRITEHERADEIARLVPLAWWLAWELDEPAPRPR